MTQASFNASINTGLQQTPDLTDIMSIGKLSFQFIQVYNAINILAQAIDTYTGNTPPSSSQSSQTAESTVIVGNTANFWCTANVNISAGFLVGLKNVSGVTNAVLAQANGGSSVLAMGISMNAASAGQPIQVLLLGLFNFGGSVTPGTIYYTSPTTPGGIVATAPSTAGQIIQPVGIGLDTNSIFFNPYWQGIVHGVTP